MSDRLKESISALVDGEAGELELRRILNADKADVDDIWLNYQLISDVLSQQATISGEINTKKAIDETPAPAFGDISMRVRDAIEQEESLAPEPAQTEKREWLKPAGGFAVAASVALTVVFGVRAFNTTSAPDSVFESSNAVASKVYAPDNRAVAVGFGSGVAQPATASASFPVQVAAPSTLQANDAETQQRLEEYLMRHTENAALNNGQGIVSFARMVNFTTSEPVEEK